MKPTITIDAAMRDKNLLGAALGDIDSWSTWMVGIKAAFGLGLITDRERETFEQIAGGRAPTDAPGPRTLVSCWKTGRKIESGRVGRGLRRVLHQAQAGTG